MTRSQPDPLPEGDAVQVGSSSTGSSPSDAPESSASRCTLLASVLAETLGRRDDDAILRSIRQTKSECGPVALDEDICRRLVACALRQSVDAVPGAMPETMLGEIARTLWKDGPSRSRLIRLWDKVTPT